MRGLVANACMALLGTLILKRIMMLLRQKVKMGKDSGNDWMLLYLKDRNFHVDLF